MGPEHALLATMLLVVVIVAGVVVLTLWVRSKMGHNKQ
jgi:Flp pilus assembly pilin Flp